MSATWPLASAIAQEAPPEQILQAQGHPGGFLPGLIQGLRSGLPGVLLFLTSPPG